MDDDLDQVVIDVRASTAGFAADVAAMRGTLQEGLGTGAATAGRSVETALLGAVRQGKIGFDDLKATALKALDEIAAASLRGAVKGALGGGGGGGGLASLASGLLGAVLGLPGRATGGPVAPGAAYLVGERGPELFVPTSSGAVAPLTQAGARDVRISIAVNAAADAAPQALAKSSRQVARAVARALDQAEG